MKLRLFFTFVALFLFIGCSSSNQVDSLFLVTEEEPPAEEPTPPPPEIIEVPVSLSLAVSSPAANSTVGYEVIVRGTCNVAGSVVQVGGDGTGFSVCQLDLTWEATVDLSAVPIGNVNLDFVLTQGEISSETVSLVLNKPSDACDDPTKRSATFATAVSPYEICTITQLENIATLVASSEVTESFILRNSLDFKGGSWSPINARFMGTFEGGGLTISNVSINSPSTDNIGLFGRGGNATFQNLFLEGFNIRGRNYVGLLVGSTENAGNILTLNNITVSDSTIDGTTSIGGLVGRVRGNTSLNVDTVSANNVNVSGANEVGGLVGEFEGSVTAASIDQVTVSGEVDGNTYVGGIVGLGDNTNLLMDNTSFSGEVRGAQNRVGGLIGRLDGGTVQNSFVVGNVTSIYDAGNQAYTGGLIGYADTTVNVDTCYHRGQVSALSAYIGGLVGRMNLGTIYDSYSTGNGDDGSIVADGAIRAVNYIGGLVGSVASSADVQRSYSTKDITVTGVMNSGSMGGLIGYTAGLNLVDSYSTGDLDIMSGDGLTSSGSSYGGVIGQLAPNGGNPTVNVSASHNTGNITVLAAGNAVYTGGLIGRIAHANGGLQTVTIDNVYNSGNIDTTNQYTGGLVGYARPNRNGDTLSITNATTSGTITVSQYGNTPTSLFIGGIIGQLDPDSGNPSTGDITISDSSSTSTFTINGTGGDYIGGIAGNVTMRRNSIGTYNNLTYTGGSITTPRGNAGGLFGRLLTNNNNVVNASNWSVTIPSITGGSVSGYVGGALGRLAAEDSSDINVTGITVNIPTITGDHQRYGGLIGDLYARDSATIDVINSTVNVTTLTNTSTQEYQGGAVGRMESRDTSAILLDNIPVNMTTLTVAGRRVGGFIGYAVGNNTGQQLLRGVSSTANVTSTATNGFTGGLVGEMSTRIELEDCFATGDVTSSGGGYAGGLAGGSSASNRRIQDCYATGTVTAPGNYVGGLVGRMYGSIINSYATGDVIATNDYVGGLVGEMRTTTIANSFATGDVTGNRYVGGLGGDILNPVTVTNSFAAGNVIGVRQVGGFMGRFRGDAGDVDSTYTLGSVTRASGTQNSFGEICGDCNSDGDVTNSFFNSDTSLILGGVGSPEVQGNTGRGRVSADLQNPATYPGSFDFVGTNDDSWRLPVVFTLPGAGAVYPYPVLYWLEN